MLRAKQNAALLKEQLRDAALLKEQLLDAPTVPQEAAPQESSSLPSDEGCVQTEATPIFIDDLKERTSELGRGSASEESASELSAAEGRCRFGHTALETVPSTPVGEAARPSLGSPPGLSRKAMRQARDACKAGSVGTASWGDRQASIMSTSPFTIIPDGKPLTPPALRSAKRRAARDALLASARHEIPTAWFGHTSQAVLSAVPR